MTQALPPIARKLIKELVSAQCLSEAAKKVGMSVTQVRQWMQRPEFVKRYRDALWSATVAPPAPPRATGGGSAGLSLRESRPPVKLPR
jgi:hypothetical protein